MMRSNILKGLRAGLATILAVAAQGTVAAELGADCKPLATAMEKMTLADHAETNVTNGQTYKAVTASGVSYLLQGGKWTKSASTPKQDVAASRDNIRYYKVYRCTPGGDAVVDGVAATQWHHHTEHGGDVSDSTVAIAKATGLPIRAESTIKGDGATMQSVSTYQYSGIRPPI